MKDQGMPLGDFRFCFPYEPCSQELKARMAALNAVTGAQIRANLARTAREAEVARLEADRSACESPDEGRGARPDRPEYGIGCADSQGRLHREA